MTRAYVPGLLTGAWAIALAVGAAWLHGYQATPGHQTAAPERWPAESRIPRVAGRPMAVLFAHPRCPCTPASMDELAWVLARCGGRVDACVVFVVPPGAPEGWEQGATWAAGPTWLDREAVEAHRFGAVTSGLVLIYDGDGRLRFEGGITAARGHRGANPGRTAALEALTGKAGRRQAEVFGCPL